MVHALRVVLLLISEPSWLFLFRAFEARRVHTHTHTHTHKYIWEVWAGPRVNQAFGTQTPTHLLTAIMNSFHHLSVDLLVAGLFLELGVYSTMGMWRYLGQGPGGLQQWQSRGVDSCSLTPGMKPLTKMFLQQSTNEVSRWLKSIRLGFICVCARATDSPENGVLNVVIVDGTQYLGRGSTDAMDFCESMI
ncbi:hypothetical protein BDW69DRAFT_111576 [Aspergillus filifer]